MFRLFFIFFFTTTLFSQTINFKESKYIEALNTSTSKYGYITFNKNSIETSYKNSEEVLSFQDDTLYIKNGKETTTIDLNRDMPKKIYFTILEAIYLDDLSKLELYFDIKKENKTVSLKPKGVVSNYLKSIDFKKDKKLEFLNIYLLNNDRIKVEQID